MSNLVTLKINGIPSEGGHILVSDFIGRIEHLLSALNGIDRLVGKSGQPTLDYRIVSASHRSPLTFTLEPVLKKRVSKPEPRHIEARHERFFHEVVAIRNARPVSPDVDESILLHMRALVEGVGKDFQTASLMNTSAKVKLDSQFETNIRRLLDEEDSSYGNEEGMLEAVNIHGPARICWIYPRVGAVRIRCEFLPGTRDQIRDNLGKYVRVEGVKYFRPNSPFPFRVKVREFEAMEDDEPIHLRDLGGIAPNATGQLSALEFVRKIRDEWD